MIQNNEEDLDKILKESSKLEKNDFIKSVLSYYRKNKRLSDRQFFALRDWYVSEKERIQELWQSNVNYLKERNNDSYENIVSNYNLNELKSLTKEADITLPKGIKKGDVLDFLLSL